MYAKQRVYFKLSRAARPAIFFRARAATLFLKREEVHLRSARLSRRFARLYTYILLSLSLLPPRSRRDNAKIYI